MLMEGTGVPFGSFLKNVLILITVVAAIWILNHYDDLPFVKEAVQILHRFSFFAYKNNRCILEGYDERLLRSARRR